MDILKTVADVRAKVSEWKIKGSRVGLVPTMGYLHQGHASLIRRAVQECDTVVVSVFVNPAQFGPNEDLASYPRDLERDAALCEKLGAALIFAPEPAEMYPEGFAAFVEVERLGEPLCGRSRPTHFRGVCTVVTKLFNIVGPHKAYFGQKDAQQAAILSRMVRDLNMPLELEVCPIVREDDGLAMSSRNAYLNEAERRAALVLSRALFAAQELFGSGERQAEALVRRMESVIAAEPLARLDYAEVADAENLTPAGYVERPALAALAVYIGKTRLIDNVVLSPGASR